MKKVSEHNLETDHKSTGNESRLSPKPNLDETHVPLIRSVQSMPAFHLDQTQDMDENLAQGIGQLSETQLPNSELNSAIGIQGFDALSQLETFVPDAIPSYAQPTQTHLADTSEASSQISSPQFNINAQWSDLIGSELGGCRVERILGQGGMGVVFKGRHLVLDIEVAIKCLPPHASSVAAQERFGLEARVAAKLNHPNVVAVYHAGVERGLHFIVMELVEGESLEDKIRRNGLLNINEALAYCIDICKALDYAERQGVVHRDLKPGNILVNHDQVAKLADLGLVKMMNKSPKDGALTHQGVAMGTPHYMAPEQVRDAQSVDHRADLYSLGCTLYQMVCGQTVFEASNVQDLLKKHLKQSRPKAQEVNPNLPKGLSELIERLLNPDPEQRPSSAAVVEKEIYGLFDQWATLPNPIILPSHKHRSRLTYHLESLDLEKKKNKKLSYLMLALTGASVILLIFYLTEKITATKQLQSTIVMATNHSQAMNQPAMNQQVSKATGSQTQRLLLKAERAEQIAEQATSMIGTTESRLIKEPNQATEYYWNSIIYRLDQQFPMQLVALIESYKQGLYYVDVAEEIIQVSEKVYGPKVANTNIQALLKVISKPALQFAYLKSQSKFLAINKKEHYSQLENLKKQYPDYFPIYFEQLKLLKIKSEETIFPLIKQLILIKEIKRKLDSLVDQNPIFYLSQYYYHDRKVRQIKLSLESLDDLLDNYESSINEPLKINLSLQKDESMISVYPNGILYDKFKSIKYAHLDNNVKINKHLFMDQGFLATKSQSLKFKMSHYQSYGQNTNLIMFNLPIDYQGIVIFELTDKHNHVNYLAKQFNLSDEYYDSFKKLSDQDDWYNLPVAKAGLSAVGSFVKYNKTFTIYLNPIALTKFSNFVTSVEYVLRASKSKKEIYRSKKSKEITNGTQLELKGMTIQKLKSLEPVIEIHLKLKNGEQKQLKAPLWECFHKEPESY